MRSMVGVTRLSFVAPARVAEHWSDPLWRGLAAARGGVMHALAWGARHTGLPVIVVAAIAIVVSWRVLKKTAHIAIELAVALALLVAATKLGLIAW